MGQVNRVDAARLAVSRAGERAAGSVAASDAYFPFPDGLEVLTTAGIRAVVQPGGSIRDQLSIEAAEQAGITMYTPESATSSTDESTRRTRYHGSPRHQPQSRPRHRTGVGDDRDHPGREGDRRDDQG